MDFIVTKKAQRPAGRAGECFYCGQAIGERHRDDCVLVQKRVKVRMIVEYEVDVPAFWDKERIEFHRNDGSWCADNALAELRKLSKQDGCLCAKTAYQYIGGDSDPFLREKG